MINHEQNIGNLIDKQGVSFIATVNKDGFHNMISMLTQSKREGNRVFWFTTNASSMPVVQS
jgi:general stress protein 26